MLTEAQFTEIVDAGCTKCRSKRVLVEAYVTQKLPLLGGEIYGKPSWGYKGEDLVKGTYRIACADCDADLFTSSACPRCEAADRLSNALESENTFPMPVRCMSCENEQLTVTAYVPATVVYEGKRAAPARTQTAPEDEGFHAFRAECKGCRNTAEARGACIVCGISN